MKRIATLLSLIPGLASAQVATSSSVTSGLRGVITDAKTQETLIEATVRVVSGRPAAQALSDLDGKYELQLPPGSYELRVYYDVYAARRFAEVVVEPGAWTTLDVALSADEGAIEEVVVEARSDRRNETAVLQDRRREAAVSDAVSAQEVSKSGDSSAASAVKRVVSASIKDGRYVQIRGLGNRYTPTLLNGVVLPSIEPDDYAVPLDLFPSSLLANLTVVKTHRARLPGAFAGGALLLSTQEYPSERELKLRLGSAAELGSTFTSSPGEYASLLDFFGYGAAARELPAAVPTDAPLTNGGERGMDSAALDAAGRGFGDRWTPSEGTARPALSLGASLGDTLTFGSKKLGYLAAISFGSERDGRSSEHATTKVEDGVVRAEDEFSQRRGTENALLGGLVSAGLELSPNDSIGVFALYAHNGTARSLEAKGLSNADSTQYFQSTRLEYVERSLLFGQLLGEHLIGELGLRAKWQANASMVSRDEPDTRDVQRNVIDADRLRLKTGPGSGERFFSALIDRSVGAGLELEERLSDALTLSAGGSLQYSARRFGARRFHMDHIGSTATALFLSPEEMFSDERLGTDFRLIESTLANDAYTGSSWVASGYLEGELAATDALRIVAGARLETAAQALTVSAPTAVDGNAAPPVSRQDLAFLPSLNLVYALTPAMNLRAAYSYTLARPMFREIAAFLYRDFERRRSVTGNPDLVETRIHNQDLRWEWFASDTELLAVSAFAKELSDPIETVFVSASNNDISYRNADGATLFGGELEARVSLGRIDDALRYFKAGFNLALVYSRVELGDEAIANTSRSRALQGQSPLLANLSLGFLQPDWGTELTALFNLAWDRIAEAGTEGRPDSYERAAPRLDLVARQTLASGLDLKLSLLNLLAQSEVYQTGDVVTYRLDRGVAASLAIEWRPE